MSDPHGGRQPDGHRATPEPEIQTEPDGERSAVGGHVNIDVAPGDAEAALRKMKWCARLSSLPQSLLLPIVRWRQRLQPPLRQRAPS